MNIKRTIGVVKPLLQQEVSKTKYITPECSTITQEDLGIKLFQPSKDSFQITRGSYCPQSEAEYNSLIDELMELKHPSFYYSCIKFNESTYGKKIPNKYLGLLPYCGYLDFSSDINRYLSGRQLEFLTEDKAEKLCQALKYSLKELDKEYGTYTGYVYRGGYFMPNTNQYYSSIVHSNTGLSDIPSRILGHSGPDNLCLNIIYTKSGHKINKFQQDYIAGAKVLNQENEILLPQNINCADTTNIRNKSNVAKLQNDLYKSIISECFERIKNGPYDFARKKPENIILWKDKWENIDRIKKSCRVWEEI